MSREKLNSTQLFRHRGHRAAWSSQMPEQNVSIKNRTTAGMPQCTAGSAYGSYVVITVYMETRLKTSHKYVRKFSIRRFICSYYYDNDLCKTEIVKIRVSK